MLYNKYFSSYEELIRYYPRFYREVREMKAILQAYGKLADDLEASIEQVVANAFIGTADEETISELEQFLNLTALSKERTLEERRRLVKSFFVGNGRVSASSIKETIRAYTGADSDISFEPFDETGNNRLYINFERGNYETIYLSDIYELLKRKIPAHIEYREALVYRFGICVGRKRTHYTADYPVAGVYPEISKLGSITSISAETDAAASFFRADYSFCGELDAGEQI